MPAPPAQNNTLLTHLWLAEASNIENARWTVHTRLCWYVIKRLAHNWFLLHIKKHPTIFFNIFIFKYLIEIINMYYVFTHNCIIIQSTSESDFNSLTVLNSVLLDYDSLMVF